MGVNSLPKTVTLQHRNCDLNPGRSAPESSALTTRLPSHTPKQVECIKMNLQDNQKTSTTSPQGTHQKFLL